MNKKKIILASNSPRRKEILQKGRIDFEVIKSNYKEDVIEYYDDASIKKNSLYKALDVASKINEDALIIGADTMVILDSVCLLKPLDYKKAFFMLKKLSGKTHTVATSISIVDSSTKKHISEITKTKVIFKDLTDDEIKSYINNFKPFDKAGSYGIQDFISINEIENPPKESFIKKIEGDYYNVMGISLETLNSMLNKFQAF